MIPVNPAIITKAIVNEVTPPNAEAIWIAIGVVIDFGNSESTISFEKPTSLAKSHTASIPTTTPINTPPSIGSIFF